MQPPHHHHASQTGNDAAGLDPSAASMTVAADNVVAAASAAAALTVRAPAENKAAASPATATRSIVTNLARCWQRWRERRRRQRRIALHELSERELTDIGVTRVDIEYISALQELDRLKSDTTMWTRSGA
jgi:uncharacterized protein YjiS (DUF1127 family)